MTLTPSRETEQKIAAQAREHGLSLEQYATQIFEREAVHSRQKFAIESLQALLEKLAGTDRPAKEYGEDFFSRE